MRQAADHDRVAAPAQVACSQVDDGPADLVGRAAALLATPALVILTGGPGCGRSTALRRVAAALPGRVFAGGALSALRSTPAFALTHALRVRLPTHDPALLVEAVRARVGTGLLVIDDLQWADPLTLDTLTALAGYCRVAAALRLPHRLPPPTVAALRAAAAGWLPVPPLPASQARAMVASLAPRLTPPAVDEIVRRAGGAPLAVLALTRHATAAAGRPPTRAGADGPNTSGSCAPADTATAAPRPPEPVTTGNPTADHDPTGTDVRRPPDDQVTYAVATALADLTRPARTALAALGLLGRPAPATLIGPAAEHLAAADLVRPVDQVDSVQAGSSAVNLLASANLVAPVCPYVAEVAAGLLDEHTRRALHRRLAELLPAGEAARHLAAAGDHHRAYQRATEAAAATTDAERADLLLLACDLPGRPPDQVIRHAAARAALACGRPQAAVRALATAADPTAAVLRGEALTCLGHLASARAAVTPVPDSAPAPLPAARDRVLLLAALADDPAAAVRAAGPMATRHGANPSHVGLAAAFAAVRAAVRAPGWEHALAAAATAADAAGDRLTTRWSAWLLVESLTADGRLARARRAATAAADACAAESAYGWQTRFHAAGLWCAALGGTAPTSDVSRLAVDLTDRRLPALARGYATAAACLVEADGGLLAAARSRLAATDPSSGPLGRWLAWLTRETSWLDGVAVTPPEPAEPPPTAPLPDGLLAITTCWARHDKAVDVTHATPGPAHPAGHGAPTARPATPTPPYPPEVTRTLAAWRAGDPAGFAAAAAAWGDLVPREQVRCLLAQAVHEPDPARAVPALLAAEDLADRHALVVLRGRARRELRRHGLRRGAAAPAAAGALTGRERDVLALVAAGEASRRIAGRLGLSTETVETHIRAAMRKLGARTRTEAAALALPLL